MAPKPHLEKFRILVENAMPYPPPEVDLYFRPMFGGLGIYVRERIFSIVMSEGLAIKFPPDVQAQLRAQVPDVKHLSWTQQYLIVPPYIYDDEAQLGEWLQLSIDYVLSQPLKRKRSR